MYIYFFFVTHTSIIQTTLRVRHRIAEYVCLRWFFVIIIIRISVPMIRRPRRRFIHDRKIISPENYE